MARGVKGSGPQVAGLPMTSDDMAQVEQRIEGKRSPLHEDDFKDIEHKMATRDVMTTPAGQKIARVGNFQAALNYGDSQTLKKFARIEPDYTGWIKMTNDQALLYQDLRVLIGHDGDKKLGLIDPRKLDRIKQQAKQGDLTDKESDALEQLEATQ